MRRLLSRLTVLTAVTAMLGAGLVDAASAATTATSTTPAATFTGFRAGHLRVALTWKNPASTDLTKVALRYAAGHTPTSLTDGTGVSLASAKATNAVATGLHDGTAYTFVLFAVYGSGTTTPSKPLTATPHAARDGNFTISLGRSSVGPGVGHDSAWLSGTYVDAAGKKVGGLRVAVMRRYAGTTTWVRVSTLTTGPYGGIHMWAHPKRNAFYRFHLPASAYDADTVSKSLELHYAPSVWFFAPALARTYTTFTMSGSVHVRRAGQSVVLRRYVSGAWHSVAWAKTDSKGVYTFSMRVTDDATRSVRVAYPATTTHLSAVSPVRHVDVVPRDLSSGMSGPDVLAVQKRLAALHYDVGTPDGQFGYDTLHAVTAFQKVNGLSRTGAVGEQTLAALSSPKTLVRHHLVSGRSVEVDLTRQVAALYQDGHLYRVIDISSGSGQVYYEDGVRNVAITPTGSFRIERKIDGMRISTLGALWRPSYFYEGYALHGSNSVPPYPASHGCVRMTNNAVDRYFDWLVIGARVYVFH